MQGAGVASALVRAAEGRLAAHGCSSVQIEYDYSPGDPQSERLRAWCATPAANCSPTGPCGRWDPTGLGKHVARGDRMPLATVGTKTSSVRYPIRLSLATGSLQTLQLAPTARRPPPHQTSAAPGLASAAAVSRWTQPSSPMHGLSTCWCAHLAPRRPQPTVT
jgi:hypothetical protein